MSTAEHSAAAPVPAIREANLDVPSAMGIMVGAPPLPENRVTFENSSSPRFQRWTMMHAAAVFNTVRISRGNGPVSPLPQGEPLDIDALRVTDHSGLDISMQEYYRRTGLDAQLVLYRGQVVSEKYLGDMRADTLHTMFSCTKSLVGTLVATLAHECMLDLSRPASHYVPELSTAAIGSATLQQLLDMRANFRLSIEAPRDGGVDVAYHRALGLFPRPCDYAGPEGACEALMTTQPDGEHGVGPFRYLNGSTEALGWVLRKVSGMSLATLFSERLWIPLGAERDADFILDSRKSEWAAAGMAATLRDIARFGEMMRQGGTANGRRIVPEAVVADIMRGGDREAFATSERARYRPGGSYRNQWWINHDPYRSYDCSGQFGQRIWVAPGGDTVIVRFSTDPDSTNSRAPLILSAFHAITAALQARQ